MQIIKAYYEILTPIDGPEIMRFIEKIGRVCYKSEEKITSYSYRRFIEALIERGHEAMLEHFSITVKFVCDRGVSHELVRHRLASFAQESTRYCNYGTENKGLTFIQPCWFKEDVCGSYGLYFQEVGSTYDHINKHNQLINDYSIINWISNMLIVEELYNDCLERNWSPQEARSILPNSLKTEIVITANLREWRHIFSLRADSHAHPQMRELMIPLLTSFYNEMPELFEDIMSKIHSQGCGGGL